MSINTGVSGRYNMVVTHSDGSTTETGWFKNIILDKGLKSLVGYDSLLYYNTLYYCWVGSGNTPPDKTQTNLAGTLKGGTTATNPNPGTTYLGSPTHGYKTTFRYQFTLGSIIGTIAEVAVGNGATTSVSALFSRTLIVDGNGIPVTLTLSATDQLTVFYELTISPNLSDVTGSVDIGGITYNFTARPANLASWFGPSSGGISKDAGQGLLVYTQQATYQSRQFYLGGPTSVMGAITSTPTNTTYAPATSWAYSAPVLTGTGYYVDATFTWTPDYGNISGGIKTLYIGVGSQQSESTAYSFAYQKMFFQLEFDTPIPKINTQTLSLTFRYAVDRV